MKFIIQSIVLAVFSCMMLGTQSCIDSTYAFHQNYPEFDTEEEARAYERHIKLASVKGASLKVLRDLV